MNMLAGSLSLVFEFLWGALPYLTLINFCLNHVCFLNKLFHENKNLENPIMGWRLLFLESAKFQMAYKTMVNSRFWRAMWNTQPMLTLRVFYSIGFFRIFKEFRLNLYSSLAQTQPGFSGNQIFTILENQICSNDRTKRTFLKFRLSLKILREVAFGKDNKETHSLIKDKYF